MDVEGDGEPQAGGHRQFIMLCLHICPQTRVQFLEVRSWDTVNPLSLEPMQSAWNTVGMVGELLTRFTHFKN